jgi:hypothetical protein
VEVPGIRNPASACTLQRGFRLFGKSGAAAWGLGSSDDWLVRIVPGRKELAPGALAGTTPPRQTTQTKELPRATCELSFRSSAQRCRDDRRRRDVRGTQWQRDTTTRTSYDDDVVLVRGRFTSNTYTG